MNATAEKPEYTPIPVQLSEKEFNEFILPHLSRLLLRFERIQQRHLGMKLMAYTLINLRERFAVHKTCNQFYYNQPVLDRTTDVAISGRCSA